MKNARNNSYERSAAPWAKATDVLRVFLWDVWILPLRWRYRLKHISVPVLLTEIERTIGQARLLSLSPRTIAWLVRLRIACTLYWRRNRCLLNSLLLLHCLARTQREVTLHLECRLEEEGRIAGHCWVSGPGLEEAARWMPSAGKTEIHRRTFDLRRRADSASRSDCRLVENPHAREDCTPV